MNKWTPGPWKVFEPGQDCAGMAAEIATLYSVSDSDSGYVLVRANLSSGTESDAEWYSMRQADARLIAAAPEMAEELQMSFRVMDEVREMLRDRNFASHAAELAERQRAISALLSRIGGDK